MTRSVEDRGLTPPRRWRVLALGATLLLARPLDAQESTPEIPRPQSIDTRIAGGLPAPTSSYTEVRASEPPPVPSWDFFGRVGAGWESNPRFAPTGSEDSTIGSVGGGLLFQRVNPRGAFQLGGTGRYVRYPKDPDLDRFNGRGDLLLTRRLSPRSLFNLSSSTELADGLSSRLLVDSGLLYNARVRTLSNWSSASLEQRIGDRSAFVVDAEAEIVTFDDPALRDGHQIVAMASLSRQTSAHTNLGANYSHVWSSRSGVTVGSDLVFGSFSARPGQRTLVNLSAGGTRGTVTGRWEPYGVAQFVVNTRRSSFTLRASTTVSQAYGLGRERAVAMAGATVTRLLGRRASFSLGASYSRSTDVISDVTGDSGAFETGEATATLDLPLSGHFGLESTGYYQVRRSPQADVLDIRTGGVTVYMYLRRIER